MGGTTPVAHGGNPQDRTGSPRPRCIAYQSLAIKFYLESPKTSFKAFNTCSTFSRREL
ncbi:hypothetical protein [Moorena sp. SIO4G3]|uniref:hypothetical protein n=1 Tax=Moorena sp. SIO4G3 TaxID=2607821 RepID=UPI00142BFC24|nr:hypothetical protein [Moorena sp. SIO4G3]NEO82503.1 hypothetical protein [Moorena sp. SIO4G3]